MHKPESVKKNEKQKILCNSEIQTHQLIPARKPDLVIFHKIKNKLPNNGLRRPGGPQSKNLRKRQERQGLASFRELKNQWNIN